MRTFVKVLITLVLVDFLALTGYVMWAEGISGIWAFINSGPIASLVVFDLMIALTIGCGWMIGDAKRKGLSPLPFLAVTATTGSAGLLLYLLRRERADA